MSLSDDEITQLIKSKYFAKYLGISEASNIKLINIDKKNIPESGLSIFIHDQDSN